jgi:hypothetical protein
LLLNIPDPHQSIRLPKWEGSDKQDIHHAEDGAVGADAEGKRDHRDGCESRTFHQQADAETEVMEETFHNSSQLSVLSCQ